MSFEPDHILRRQAGNNADALTVNVRVMNGVQPTSAQLGKLQHAFKMHKLNVQFSPAGFLVRNGELPDGSRYRIVSNSGKHDVMIWPVEAGGKPPLESYFFAAPRVFDGTRPDWEAKPAGHWEFRGKTDAPTSQQFKSARKVFDAVKTRQTPGNLTWFSPTFKIARRPVVVSWRGRASRYGKLDWAGHHAHHSAGTSFATMYCPGATSGAFSNQRTSWRSAYHAEVWINGVKHQVQKVAAGVVTPVPVMSAAMKHVDGASAQLWVVSYEGGDQPTGTPQRLSVYMGTAGNPYTGSPITVAKQFDIDFWQGAIAGEIWEALVQPLYFNASCTKLAGLVALPKTSTSNTAAAAAIVDNNGGFPCTVLIQVDLLAQTTTFDASGVKVQDTVTTVYTGAPTGVDADGGGGGTSDEHRVTDWTQQRIMFGAVDFAGDQLTVAMIDHQIIYHFEEDGAWSVGSSTAAASASKTMTATVRTKYRVYRQHDDVTLAAKDSGVVSAGDITATAEGSYDSTLGARIGRGSGSRHEFVSEDLYWFVSIEGGDLRHDWIVVGEFVEVGTSTYTDTFANDWTFGNSLDPFARMYFFGDPIGTPVYDILRGIVASGVKQRVPVLRYAVAHGGAVVETGAHVLELGRAGWSIFGLILSGGPIGSPAGGEAPPFSQSDVDSNGHGRFWSWGTLIVASLERNDVLPYAIGGVSPYFTPGASVAPVHFRFSSPLTSVGNPYANNFAASTDGVYVFYEIGSSTRVTENPSAWTVSGAFYIDGARHAIAPADYFPTQALAVLHTPVFIDNVPKE